MEETKRILTENELEQLIDYLQGSSKSLQEAINDLFECDEDILTPDDHQAIDGRIFKCNSCDWWCEIDEQNDEGNCEDCGGGDEEDE